MALDPHLFTAPHLGRQRLRDHIIDLNQSMDVDAIVTKMLTNLRRAAKTHPFARHFLDAHTPAERRRIVETNLRRLRIRFADGHSAMIVGASDDFDIMWPWEKEYWEWWGFNFDDESDDPDEDDDWYKKGSINKNEHKQLDEIMRGDNK
jgi:hypothetical protein